MNYKGIFVSLFLFAMFVSAEPPEDYIGPPVAMGEISLVEMPDSFVFSRSDSSLMQYNWSVRFRVFSASSVVPDVFSMSLKYTEQRGDGSFRSNILSVCEMALERRGVERTFYRVGDLSVTPTDSSLVFSGEMNPALLAEVDSVQVYGVTDYVPGDRYRLRDITDYGRSGEVLWDRVGDISDRRFDIRFVTGEIVGLPPQHDEE